MKNRTSTIFAISIGILAIIGVISRLVYNPAHFFQSIAVMVVVVAIIYFLFIRFFKTNPQRKEQRAFLRAAKQTKKKINRKKTDENHKSANTIKLTSLRKKSTAHLTVIEGKKNKKKNRATF